MCEILLCVRNMGNSGDLRTDSHSPKQGDVIAVVEDGHVWGECELGGRPADPANNPHDEGFAPGELVYTRYDLGFSKRISEHPNTNHPFFRIVKLPNVTVAQAEHMLTVEVDTDPANPSPYLQYRQFYLDKSKLVAMHAALALHLADDLRSNAFISVPYTAAQINQIVSERLPIPF